MFQKTFRHGLKPQTRWALLGFDKPITNGLEQIDRLFFLTFMDLEPGWQSGD